MDIVQRVAKALNLKEDFPLFKAGDTVSVSVKVHEGSKTRTQIFKGVVIKVQGKGVGRSFTVRKMSSGIGVERTFPFTSPAIEKIKLESRGKVRRSRLFYLRDLRGRAARLQSEMVRPEQVEKKASAKKEDAPNVEESVESKEEAKA